MTGTANITVQQVRDALLVPNTALRFTPPQGASKPAGDGGLVSNLMPRPPSSASKPVDSAEDKQPHVWVLHEGNLKKVALKTGMTDGVMTEMREGKLEPDMTVVVDVIEANK